jgi:membrane protein
LGPKEIFGLLKDTFKEWKEDKASRHGAALAYYTIFSIGPLLIIVIAIVGFVFGDAAARGEISAAMDDVLGADGAEAIQTMIQNASQPGAGILATVIGIVTLFLSASGLFVNLQDSLNTIWEVTLKPGLGLLATIKARLLSFSMVLGVGFLLLVSLVVNAVLAMLGRFLQETLPGGALVWQVVNFAISVGIITLLFAMIYKVLPDVKLGWSDVWIGSIITALLFILGQMAIGFYLGISDVGSSYGAAGSLVVVLVWIYYSAQILFFGAEFTQVYAKRYGSGIRPEEHAMFLSEEAKAQQGIKSSEAGAQERQRRERKLTERLASPWFR